MGIKITMTYHQTPTRLAKKKKKKKKKPNIGGYVYVATGIQIILVDMQINATSLEKCLAIF